MQAIAQNPTQREQNEQARARALVRFNALAFYSLAAASFLETAVPRQANRLVQVFHARPDVAGWLEQVWWPQRAELGRRLREYVESTWPEFQWSAGYDDFQCSHRPRGGVTGGAALEALGLCVTSAQSALFYRALSGSADEPVLRELARDASIDHAAYFDYFRALFERCRRIERVGIAATWRAVGAVSRSARDHDVAAAFMALDANWRAAPIVPALGYPDYRERMAQLILRCARLGPVERLLFRPWIESGRASAGGRPATAARWASGVPQAA